MQPWFECFQKMGDKFIDKGMSLSHPMTLTKDGVEPGNPGDVAYEVIQADDRDTALEMMKDNPHLQREGARIQIHETWNMNGMIK